MNLLQEIVHLELDFHNSLLFRLAPFQGQLLKRTPFIAFILHEHLLKTRSDPSICVFDSAQKVEHLL